MQTTILIICIKDFVPQEWFMNNILKRLFHTKKIISLKKIVAVFA